MTETNIWDIIVINQLSIIMSISRFDKLIMIRITVYSMHFPQKDLVNPCFFIYQKNLYFMAILNFFAYNNVKNLTTYEIRGMFDL